MSETDLSANPKLISLTLQPYPTNDIVARCISINFQKSEQIYCMGHG